MDDYQSARQKAGDSMKEYKPYMKLYGPGILSGLILFLASMVQRMLELRFQDTILAEWDPKVRILFRILETGGYLLGAWAVFCLARKKRVSRIFTKTEKMSTLRWGLFAAAAAIGILQAVTHLDVGTVSLLKDLRKNGITESIVLYASVFFKAFHFTVLMAVVQRMGEGIFRNRLLAYPLILIAPYLIAGIFHGMEFWPSFGLLLSGIIAGSMYLIMGRDFKKTWFAIFFLYIL